jgi:hypothetical protein
MQRKSFDRNSIISTDYNSKSLSYTHNSSIVDGYTLRLVRGRDRNQL